MRLGAKDRVAQAYHDFGRFCSAHPSMCLVMSILTMIFLSYPAVVRFHLPSSPFDIYLNGKSLIDQGEVSPSWLAKPPAVFVQQVVVRGVVEPWNSSNLTAEQSVRGPLSRAFLARSSLLSIQKVDELCFHVSASEISSQILPARGCLLVSPTNFWNSSLEDFQRDSDILRTIFDSTECMPNHCLRDMVLGMPSARCGIKKIYQTNRKRTIAYALTLFLAHYDERVRESIKVRLVEDGFDLVRSQELDEMTYVHVHYNQKKDISDYIPLLSSYLIFMLYLYYSARKFEMVASRFGLALAAAFNVAATLFISTGVCAYLDIMPTLWAAEIYPYIALILGLENTLCITRSVVNTPPSLDVSSRLAHGLSQEGYSLCKYFILELVFLVVGYVTRVSEIQEFCILATVGLIVDFYMQLFFYAPCLTFDLRRLNVEDKHKFARMMFGADIPCLKTFNPVNCPMRRLFPRMFDEKRWQKRKFSDSQLDDKEIPTKADLKRSNSINELLDEPEMQIGLLGKTKSARLRLLYFVTRTRIMQRTIMVLFSVWTVWLAFFVHSRRSADGGLSLGVSHRVLESTPQEWREWQRHTFSWVPILFAEYNISLDGQHFTFLPPIAVSTKVPPSDPFLEIKTAPDGSHFRDFKDESAAPQDLQYRIFWLETQLKIYLVAFFVLLLTTVLSFILYVCFWDKWRPSLNMLSRREDIASISSSNIFSTSSDLLPLRFVGHRFPIECVAVCGENRVVSVCQEGRVYVWNTENGQRIGNVSRCRVAQHVDCQIPPVPMPRIWTIDASSMIAVLGCSDGSVEIACLVRTKLIGVYHQSKSGSSAIRYSHAKNRMVIARLDGVIDFIEILLTYNEPKKVSRISLLHSSKAHTKLISQLLLNNNNIVSASFDFTMKVFDLNGTLIHTLLSHNAPISSLATDHRKQTLFSVCEEGLINWWDLSSPSADVVRSVRVNFVGSAALTTLGDHLVAYSQDGSLSVWHIVNGLQELYIPPSDSSLTYDSSLLLALENHLIAVVTDCKIKIWDLRDKTCRRQILLPCSINTVHHLSTFDLICVCGNTIYKINRPVC